MPSEVVIYFEASCPRVYYVDSIYILFRLMYSHWILPPGLVLTTEPHHILSSKVVVVLILVPSPN